MISKSKTFGSKKSDILLKTNNGQNTNSNFQWWKLEIEKFQFPIEKIQFPIWKYQISNLEIGHFPISNFQNLEIGNWNFQFPSFNNSDYWKLNLNLEPSHASHSLNLSELLLLFHTLFHTLFHKWHGFLQLPVAGCLAANFRQLLSCSFSSFVVGWLFYSSRCPPSRLSSPAPQRITDPTKRLELA